MKRAEREKMLAAEGESKQARPKSSRAARSAMAGKVDPKTVEMRRSLAKVLRQEDLTTDLRIRSEPVPALQRASEAYLAGLPGDISLCAVHGLPGDISLCAVKSNRVAATPNDIQQAYH
ncbi:histone H3.3 [Amphibalanus amphitrite]|uniref:Histone H3.3 n=1 Tax=Amphibalanus amphitrite TaxID=1232801 RepID=A0A6A4WHW7_AMPAM|nr:histone H3.3 [Amphibalanus amphitrite]